MVIRKIKHIAGKFPKPDWKVEQTRLTISHELYEFKKAFKENFAIFAVSGLGLATALTWNEVIKQAVTDISPRVGGELLIKAYSAFIVTMVAIFFTYWVSKWKSKSIV